MARPTISKYGVSWDAALTPLQIEFGCIKKGGRWQLKTGAYAGLGLFQHHRNAQSLIWPHEEHNRWSDLMLQNIVNNTVTVVFGPKSSGKTHTAAKFALVDYFVWPDETTILVSSTDLRGLELRVWGDLKSMLRQAKDLHDYLPGHVLDSKHAVSTDSIDEEGFRDMRNGIICIPCLSSSGQYVGLGKYVGIKNKRVRLCGDEVQFMKTSFLEAISNLDSNPDFKAVLLGNPLGPQEPLCMAGEPRDGWNSIGEVNKTKVWESKFLNGRTINLVGTDSPNFDFPQDQPPRYPYLIHKAKIDSTVAFYGMNSHQYFSQCLGVMKAGLDAHRVITREMCKQFKAYDDVIWDGGRTKIYAIDAAYGNIGGDRCVGGWIEFGKDMSGKIVISVGRPTIIPVSVRSDKMPEDQIAQYVMDQCVSNDIPPENVYFDSTGRGSLGTAFARIWSAQVNPVEFGGVPTLRPVSLDIYIRDFKTNTRRLKTCREHYSKFVTELWFSWRYAIEASQIRNLPPEVVDEGCMREWKTVRGDKIEIEAKDETKERMGRSPDLADWLVCAIEGARRKGFLVSKLASGEVYEEDGWLDNLKRESWDWRRKGQLNYAA